MAEDISNDDDADDDAGSAVKAGVENGVENAKELPIVPVDDNNAKEKMTTAVALAGTMAKRCLMVMVEIVM